MESRETGRPDSERFVNFKLAFSMATHCLLTACSREDFGTLFSFLNSFQQDALYKLYTQMVVSVQENLQEEFNDICEETRVVDACDDDFLLSQQLDNNRIRSRIKAVGKENIVKEKLCELEYLKLTLEKMKEQNEDSASKLQGLKDNLENSESLDQTNSVMLQLKELSAKLRSTVGNKKKVEIAL